VYYEVSWLGRGGQGAVTASRLLAKALVEEGLWAQSIVFFGAERRGAPVYAYTRISDKPIKYHHFVYKPDIAIVFESSLLKITNILQQVKPNATIILNHHTHVLNSDIDLSGYKVGIVDATGIAINLNLRVAGIPVVNTAMLGAFAKVMKFPTVNTIMKIIRESWPSKIGELNAEAAKLAYEKTEIIEPKKIDKEAV